jgi:hypothetical protein
MTTPIDWRAALDGTRPVTTRDGRKVTLYCVDAPGGYPVHGRIEGENCPRAWNTCGCLSYIAPDSSIDLIQPPKRIQREYWVNLYSNGGAGYTFSTKDFADQEPYNARRLACVRIAIDCEEGEGL